MKAKVPLTGKMAVLVTSITGMLDARMAFRLSIIMAGMMLANDRRVAAARFKCRMTGIAFRVVCILFLGRANCQEEILFSDLPGSKTLDGPHL